MSDASTAAYLKAIEVLKGVVHDPIELSAIDAIDLNAICTTPREGHPTDDNGLWSLRELQRWYIESEIRNLRRRAKARMGATADDAP